MTTKVVVVIDSAGWEEGMNEVVSSSYPLSHSGRAFSSHLALDDPLVLESAENNYTCNSTVSGE